MGQQFEQRLDSSTRRLATVNDSGFAAFLDRYGEESAEIAWSAGLAWLERAAETAREGRWGRFRHYPAGELRRLRRDVAGALSLCRLAVALQDDDNELLRELTDTARAAAGEKGRARRREGSREAERVRLLKAKARREGRELTDEERYPWFEQDGDGSL